MDTRVGNGVGPFAVVGVGSWVIWEAGFAVGSFNARILSENEQPVMKRIAIRMSELPQIDFLSLDCSNHFIGVNAIC
jgi:hypothetical protein